MILFYAINIGNIKYPLVFKYKVSIFILNSFKENCRKCGSRGL